MTRELTITYGGFAIGGTSTTFQIDSKIRITKSFPTSSVEFDLVVASGTEAGFAGAISSLEAAFRKPFQNLTITQGAATLLSLSQSSNTGMDAQPEISKRESIADTGRSRRYTVRITFTMPANTGAEPTEGLRESTISVTFSPSRRRTVTISGVFTAVDVNSARAQYESKIDAYATSILTALTGTFELAEEPITEHSTNNKTINFTRIYDELIFAQAGATTLDDTSIVRQSLRIIRQRVAPGDTPRAKRLETFSVSYEAWIDKTVTVDLPGEFATIRSFIISKVQTLASGSLAIISESPEFDMDNNRIVVSMTIMGQSGSSILEEQVTVEDDAQLGNVLIPAWTGNKHSKYNYQGPTVVRRTITVVRKVINFIYAQVVDGTSSNAITTLTQLPNAPAPLSLRNFKHISSRASSRPLRLGSTDFNFDITEITTVDVFEYFEPIVRFIVA